VSGHPLQKARIAIPRTAGDAVLEVCSDIFEVRGKTHHSPLIGADKHTEAIVLKDLAELALEVHAVSKEEAAKVVLDHSTVMSSDRN